MDREAFGPALAGLSIEPSEELLAAFDSFEAALYQANEAMNLTRVPRDEAWLRHFLDSLLFHDLIPPGSSVLDIGSGPGFPAWPLAAARPDLRVTALDSNGKMLTFLRSQPLPNLEVVQARAEEWGVRERFDVVTGRALAPLAIQLELSAGACMVGGLVLPLRTPKDGDDLGSAKLEALGLALQETSIRALGDAQRMCPVLRKIRPTPAKYPRRWAEIKAKPLVR